MEDWEKEWAVRLKLCPHPNRLLSLFVFWCSLCPANPAPRWERSHQFCGSQLSHSSTALREPHRTLEQERGPGLTHHRGSLPALRSSEPPAPFPRPIVLTKDLLSLHNALNCTARRKHPSHLLWEADTDLERDSSGLCWGKVEKWGQADSFMEY